MMEWMKHRHSRMGTSRTRESLPINSMPFWHHTRLVSERMVVIEMSKLPADLTFRSLLSDASHTLHSYPAHSVGRHHLLTSDLCRIPGSYSGYQYVAGRERAGASRMGLGLPEYRSGRRTARTAFSLVCICCLRLIAARRYSPSSFT